MANREEKDIDSIEEDEEEESDFEQDEDDDSYESEEDDFSSRTLLFLCEEGQLDIALKRVREWDNNFPPTAPKSSDQDNAMIQQELFRKNPNTGNYCLHEILAGGTSGKSAPELVERLVRRYTTMKFAKKQDYRKIFLAQPTVGSNGRTVLHWCAWSRTTPQIVKMVLNACPEAMCLRDNKSHFHRRPLEIAQRYWPNDEITNILKLALRSYLPYRVQHCVHLCVQRLFLSPMLANDSKDKAQTNPENSSTLKPFDKKDRRSAGLSPRSWFVASVLGYALQREMKGLAQHIISFVGCGAKLEPKNRAKKRKRKTKPNKR